MENAPILSVIIPVYNARQYVEQCIASVLNENIRDIEILCVDDGSTDNSAAILDDMAAKDERIRVIRQSNSSAGAARNHGLKYARGRYVHFLDADDWLNPGLYGKMIRLLEKTDADVAVFQYMTAELASGKTKKCACLLDRDGEVTEFRREPAFFMYNMVAPWNKIYRLAWLNENNLRFDEIVCGNDRGFYFRMLAANGRMVLSKDYGLFYRIQNAGALTGANRYRHFDSLFFAWDTSAKAMEHEPPAVRAMLLDCVMKDLLAVFRRAPLEKRKETMQQLTQRFLNTDFSLIEELPFPCGWLQDAMQIRDGVHSCEFPRRAGDVLKQLAASRRIWGLRGCIKKYLANR